MELESRNKIRELLNNIVKNAFLIAVDKKLDLGSIVSFVDSLIHDVESENTVESKYVGLVFIELLAKEMRISIEDLLNDDIEYQRELVYRIISAISMDGVLLDIDNGEDQDDESYITYVISDLDVFDKTAKIELINDNQDNWDNESVKNDYIVELVRIGKTYSMSILTNNITTSDLFRGHVEVWQEDEGLLADYIDEAFEENITFAFKEGVSEDELVACVFEDTRTVNLMDRFEGIGDRYTKSYQRLVIKNGTIFCRYGDPYIHLIIERRVNNNIKGDVTFTDFKKGEDQGLRQHIIEELDHTILEEYCDKDQFYRFKTGYLLRAQNSKNRSGYGWVWNWKHGKGSYIKGTEYGETTDYVFVGAYISSSFLFEPTNRNSMMQWNDITGNSEQLSSNLPKEDSKLSQDKGEVDQNVDKKDKDDLPLEEITNSDKKEDNRAQNPYIYDVDKLRESADREEVMVGSIVKYKKLHLNEETEEVIGETKIVHKRLLGKRQGDLVIDGGKQYLVIHVTNS